MESKETLCTRPTVRVEISFAQINLNLLIINLLLTDWAAESFLWRLVPVDWVTHLDSLTHAGGTGATVSVWFLG